MTQDPRDPEAPPLPRFGRFVAEREIGRGGVATVYAGYPEDDPRSAVAIKCIKRGMATAVVWAAFENERRILRTLRHPGIPRLLAHGTTDDGRPFLVLEHVRGERIDHYCDRLGLDRRRRLDLFSEVCDAVRYAHRRLVVHCDLKPDNVWVDESGAVKVLDFGAARVVPRGSGDAADAVSDAGVPRTLRYASPEQFEGGPVSTSVDVYGLGALLYELMTGAPLRELEGRHPAQIATEIRERMPPRPSAHHKGLRGDLDNIILKALRIEPEKRYGSVDRLVDDIRRFREGRPVRAQPATWSYRAIKFVRRRTAVVAAIASLLVLAGAYGADLWAESRETARERDLAERERHRAERVSEFFVSLFDTGGAAAAVPGSPAEGATLAIATTGETPTAREVLDRGLRRLREHPNPEPTIQATLLVSLSRGYHWLQAYERAETIVDEALALRTRHLGARHPETVEAIATLADIAVQRGHMNEAEALYEQAIEIQRTHGPAGRRDLAGTLHKLARFYRRSDRFDRAVDVAREALATLEQTEAPQPGDVATLEATLAEALFYRGDLGEAERYLDAAIEGFERTVGPDDIRLADVRLTAAGVYERQARFEDAERAARAALDIAQKNLGPDHTRVAVCHNELAILNTILGRDERSERHLRETLRVVIEAYGEEHPDTARALRNLGTSVQRQGRHDEAGGLFERSYHIHLAVHGPDHLSLAFPLESLAHHARVTGDLERARELITRALELRDRHLGPDHPYRSHGLREAGLIARDRGALDEARTTLERALEIREQALGDGHPAVGDVWVDLGDVHERAGDPVAAIDAFERAAEIYRQNLGDDDAKVSGLVGRIAGLAGALEARAAPSGDPSGT